MNINEKMKNKMSKSPVETFETIDGCFICDKTGSTSINGEIPLQGWLFIDGKSYCAKHKKI